MTEAHPAQSTGASRDDEGATVIPTPATICSPTIPRATRRVRHAMISVFPEEQQRAM